MKTTIFIIFLTKNWTFSNIHEFLNKLRFSFFVQTSFLLMWYPHVGWKTVDNVYSMEKLENAGILETL